MATFPITIRVTDSSGAFATVTTSAKTCAPGPMTFSNPTGYGLGALIVVVTATKTPTSFQISGDPNHHFQIDNAGNLRTSSTVLVPTGTYNFSIAATNSAGQGSFMPFVVIQGTPFVDTIPPTVPTGLKATLQ